MPHQICPKQITLQTIFESYLYFLFLIFFIFIKWKVPLQLIMYGVFKVYHCVLVCKSELNLKLKKLHIKKNPSSFNGKPSFVPQWCNNMWAETLETISSCDHLALRIKKKSCEELTELLISPYLHLHHCPTKLTSHRFYTTLVYLYLSPTLSFTHQLLIRTRFTAHNPNMQLVLLQAVWGRSNPCIISKYLISSKGRKGFIACSLLLLSCAVQSFLWVLWYANMQACICTNLCSCSLRSLSCS